MNIFIIGGSREVHFLVKGFVSKGHDVTMINPDEELCILLSRNYRITAVPGDGTKPFMMEDAGVARADMVIALTGSDADNLVVCQIAGKLYGVDNTLAIVNNPDNIKIFKKLGVGTVISTSFIISSVIEQRAAVDDIQNLMELGDGQIALMEVDVPENHTVVGQKIMDIDFPEESIVSCILRGKDALIAKGNTVLEAHDRLVILSYPKVQPEIIQLVRGRID